LTEPQIDIPAVPLADSRPESQMDRVLTACAGGFASCLAWLPSLATPYWGNDLARLAQVKSLLVDGASWEESTRALSLEGSSILGAIWWRILAASPTPNPQLAHICGLIIHLMSAAMVGVLVGGVLRCIAPTRQAARAGSLAAFLYGIHPGHFYALQTADGAMGSLFAFGAAAALLASLPSDTETVSFRDFQRGTFALVASLIASSAAPFTAIVLPLAALALNRLARPAAVLPRRACVTYVLWTAMLAAAAFASYNTGGLHAGSMLRSSLEVVGGAIGVPGESIRRLVQGHWISALVMALVCGGIQVVVLSSSAFWARNILPPNQGGSALRLALFTGFLVLLIPGGELARIHLLLIGVALVIGLAFAVRLRAKALLVIVSIVGALFANEFERLSPWPAAMERARVSASVTSSMNEWQLEERRLRGEITRVFVICADEVLWESLGGTRGVAAALRVDRQDLVRTDRIPIEPFEGAAIVELTYASARTPARTPPPEPSRAP
jgi:hypothetical protein